MFVGDDVFLVLSGFAGLLVKEIQSTSRLNPLLFYARRVRRFLPHDITRLPVHKDLLVYRDHHHITGVFADSRHQH
jgi:hypothetical protein